MKLTYYIDAYKIYKTYFADKPYTIQSSNEKEEPILYDSIEKATVRQSNQFGTPFFNKNIYGKEIFLPVTFKTIVSVDSENKVVSELVIDCCTIRVTGKKTIISTPVSERVGTVHEQYNIEDYQFTIKGVIISKDRSFPEEDLQKLVDLFETRESVELHNALSDFFLGATTKKVVVESLEMPDTEGGSVRHRPFQLVCVTDYIDTLKL